MQVDQSALTGESSPATAKPGEAVFSGSIIKCGETDAMVYASGTNTYLGMTANWCRMLIRSATSSVRCFEVGNYLIVLAVVLGHGVASENDATKGASL